MARWRRAGSLDEQPVATGDVTFIGMDMRSQDPASMRQGFYREGYNVSQAVDVARDRIWSPEVEGFWDFVAAAKKRGLGDFLGARGAKITLDDE